MLSVWCDAKALTDPGQEGNRRSTQGHDVSDIGSVAMILLADIACHGSLLTHSQHAINATGLCTVQAVPVIKLLSDLCQPDRLFPNRCSGCP